MRLTTTPSARAGWRRGAAGWRRWRRWPSVITLGALVLTLALSGCAVGKTGGGSGGVIRVVAAENFWGSIAAQLGGSRVSVTNIVNDPNADPHQYESTPADARAFANANYVIFNGAGYDTWAQKLLDANPARGRQVFSVATLFNAQAGTNPHFWYNPNSIEDIAVQITGAYQALDAAHAAYYAERHTAFDTALQPYRNLVAKISATYSGIQVGSTESIFVYMAQALALNLVSPPAFMQAVSEGNDPPAASVGQFQRQIEQGKIRVLVYNTQTATSVTTNLRQLAQQYGIPTVGISEIMQPPTATFESWQVAQLQALQSALAQARG